LTLEEATLNLMECMTLILSKDCAHPIFIPPHSSPQLMELSVHYQVWNLNAKK